MAQNIETLRDQASEQLLSTINGGASSYSIGSRSVTKHDPKALYELFRKMQADADREANGMFRLAKFTRTSE